MDRVSQLVRSRNMAAVRSSRNKSTEEALVKIFRENRITGWRRLSSLVGKPDFIFPKKQLAVFVDGCFWHGCKKHGTIPLHNGAFWRKKIEGNVKRDRLVSKSLRDAGFTVLRVWEHSLKAEKRVATVKRIIKQVS